MTEKYKLKESFKAHKADFDYCEKIIKKHSKSFYAAFSTLPQQEAMSVYAVYAFCRKADDIVDETANAEELNRLKNELALFEKGEEPDHPVWRALRVVFDTYEINIKPFYDMIKGQEMDLSFEQPQTQEDLEDYSYYVAGSVGLMLLPLLAPRADELTDDAIALGVAMQITNILRDVGEDIDNDRVYLPREVMEQFGYTTEMLQNKELNQAFINLWEHEATLAEEYYEQGMNLIVHMYDYAKKPLLLSLLFYKEILEAVRLSDYNSLTKRNSVSTKRKLSLLREATSFLK